MAERVGVNSRIHAHPINRPPIPGYTTAMIPLYIFEDSKFPRLFPLTYSRSAAELRCGAFTLLERMARALPCPINGLLVRDGLGEITRRRTSLPVNSGLSTKEGVFLVNARWLMLGGSNSTPSHTGAAPWHESLPDSAGLAADAIVWIHLSAETASKIDLAKITHPATLEAVLPDMQRRTEKVLLINHPWDLLEHQHAALVEDFSAFGPACESPPLAGAASIHLLAPENIHIAPGVKLYPGVVLDATNGPIIIETGTEIRAHAVITGPVHIGKNCLIRTLADIREDNSFGPGSRVGGEVLGSIFLGHANKQHHGFVGQSIVGQWANLGAGTTTSNLKNTYGTIRMPINGVDESTGKKFLGSLIGDHAKIGIGAYLSTGSVIGFASHATVSRPPKFVPSYAWVTDQGVSRIDFEKVVAIAQTVMSRRGTEWTPADHELFVRIAGEWSQAEKFDWPTP